MPNPGPAPYTSMYNGRTYSNPNGNYHAPYTTIAYIDPVEQPEPWQPQALNGTPTADFGSQDPDPVEGPRDEASGS
jgi:hypothetical protein